MLPAGTASGSLPLSIVIVKDIAHGRRVIARLAAHPWLAFDTETESFPPYGKDDALIIGRAQIVIWSACHRGESYSFPTSSFDPKYPTMQQWAVLLAPVFFKRALTKAMHNANYDLNVLRTSARLGAWRSIYDTMIGGWLANNSIGKGLKERAPLYGRHLQSTSTVSFKDLDDLANYAEQDVVQTDEMYQMQMFGKIVRRSLVRHLGPHGEVELPTVLPKGTVQVPRESLASFERTFYFTQELPVLRATLRAERRGFPVNLTLLRDIRGRLSTDRHALMKKIFQWAGSEFNLNSGAQFVKVLHSLGVKTPYLTEKGKPSVSASALFKMSDCHQIVKDKLAYNKLEKLQTVYVGDPNVKGDLGLEYFVGPDGRIHCTLNTVGAVTGRFSASNPNLQQLPARQDLYGIRECFHAPKGYKLICLDYGQLEIRVMCLFARDQAMTKILMDPEGDIHQNTAEEFAVDRSPTAKQLNFLMLYAGGSYVLSEKLTMEGVPTTPEQAQAYVDRYNVVYPGVREFRLRLLEQHQREGFIQYWTGRRRTIDDINWSNRGSVHKAETTLSNNVVQGSGQDFLKASMVRCDPCCINPDKELPNRMKIASLTHRARLSDYAAKVEKLRRTFRQAEAQLILQVHDELIFFVQEKAAEEVANAIADVMTWQHYFPARLPYSVPITVEGGVGNTWAHAKSKKPDLSVEAGFHSN